MERRVNAIPTSNLYLRTFPHLKCPKDARTVMRTPWNAYDLTQVAMQKIYGQLISRFMHFGVQQCVLLTFTMTGARTHRWRVEPKL